MNISDFLFESIYQIVTWVFIALSIGSIFYFANQGNKKLVMWSVIGLICFTLIMIGIIADRQLFRTASPSQKSETAKDRPELSIEKAFVKTLEVGKPETIIMEVQNRGKITAHNITMYSTIVHQPGTSESLLVYGKKPPGVTASLASGASLTIDFRSEWINTAADIEAIKAGQVLLFHFGKGQYEDESGATYPFQYCFMYEPPSPNMQICPSRYVPRDGQQPILAPTRQPQSASTPLSILDRPYVVIESASIPGLAPNRPLSPVITIANKGRTPAQHLAMSLEIAAKPGFIWVLGFGKDSGRRPVGVAFLAPGDRVSVGGAPADAVTLDSKFFNDAMEGKESIMIHGQGTYEDMAGGEHPIEYSFGYHAQAKAFIADFLGPNRVEKWQYEKEKKKQRKPN
jgi:hypothetical protein